MQATASCKKLIALAFLSAVACAKKKATKPTKAHIKKVKQDNGRFYAEMEKDTTAAVSARLPLNAKFTPDPANGRWFIGYPGFKPRSISWTERGSTNAAKMVLKLAWDWALAVDGEEMPEYLAFDPAEAEAAA